MRLICPLSMSRVFLIPAMIACSAGASSAQAPPADPADVASIDAIITAAYDVISGDPGELRDWDRWHSLFADDAQLSFPDERPDGTVTRVVMSPTSWVDRNGEFVEREGFVEVEMGRVVEEYGLMAHAFSSYESFRRRGDTDTIQRGINSIQLMNDGDRWWIVSLFGLAESERFPIPERYIGR